MIKQDNSPEDILWVFDVDGTLVKTNGKHSRSAQLAFKEVCRIDISTHDILRLTQGKANEEGFAIIVNAYGRPELNTPEILTAFEAATNRYYIELLNLQCDDGLEVSGAAEFVTRCYMTGRTAFNTNGMKENVDPTLELVGMNHLFHHRRYVTCVTNPKPEPDMLLSTLAEAALTGMAPKRIVYFGDTSSDIGAVCKARTHFPQIELYLITGDPLGHGTQMHHAEVTGVFRDFVEAMPLLTPGVNAQQRFQRRLIV